MFTFGRDKEIKHAIHRLGSEEKAELLINVIISIHDFIEEKCSFKDVKSQIVIALTEGNSGVWESTGTWLIRLSEEFPLFEEIWDELAAHPKSKIRYRVACHLLSLPPKLAEKYYEILSKDKSEKVKEHCLGNRVYMEKIESENFDKPIIEKGNKINLITKISERIIKLSSFVILI